MGLNRWIAHLAPGWALRRELARRELDRLSRAYDAARPTNFRPHYGDTKSGNAVMGHARDRLRREARYLDENHDLAVGILDELVNNIVGTGIRVIPTVRTRDGRPASKVNEQIRKLRQRWERNPEATRTRTESENQRLVCRTWLRDGECLIQHLENARFAWLPAPYAVEALEPDFLPFDLVQANPRIIHGIEVNEWGRPLNYRLYKNHPGDQTVGGIRGFRTDDLKAVDAVSITHLRFVRRLHQLRGVTIFHAALQRLEDIKDYEESERIAARVAASFTGYIKRPASFAEAKRVLSSDLSFQMQPGMIFDNLPEGAEIGTIEHKRPSAALTDFRANQLRAAAAGTGVKYSSIARNFMGTWSSQRQELVEADLYYDKLRDYFIGAMPREQHERLIEQARNSGLLDVRGVDTDTLADALYIGPRMPWIDPAKEIEYIERALAAEIMSHGEAVVSLGKDPETVAQAIAAEREDATRRRPGTADPGTGTESGERAPSAGSGAGNGAEGDEPAEQAAA